MISAFTKKHLWYILAFTTNQSVLKTTVNRVELSVLERLHVFNLFLCLLLYRTIWRRVRTLISCVRTNNVKTRSQGELYKTIFSLDVDSVCWRASSAKKNASIKTSRYILIWCVFFLYIKCLCQHFFLDFSFALFYSTDWSQISFFHLHLMRSHS